MSLTLFENQLLTSQLATISNNNNINNLDFLKQKIIEIISNAMNLDQVLNIKYWGGSTKSREGKIRTILPKGWKNNSRNLQFFGECFESGLIKNYIIHKIETVSDYISGTSLLIIIPKEFINYNSKRIYFNVK